MPAFAKPEILEADLAPLALELARWGLTDPTAMAWLDAPPRAALDQAQALLRALGALDGRNRITAHGRAMAALPLHPRLAHMLERARGRGLGGLACELAAILSERDLLRLPPGQRDADLRLRIEALRGDGGALPVNPGTRRRALEAARQWQRRLRLEEGGDVNQAGALLALAYPDRIGQRRPGSQGQFRLSNGRGALFGEPEPLAAADWIVAADLDGQAREARIFLAAPVALADLEAQSDAEEQTWVIWDERAEAVQARRGRRLGAILLFDRPLTDPDPELVRSALLAGIRQMGLSCLPWDDGTRNWLRRVAFLRRSQIGRASCRERVS
jgi:ATP-dependent helicase HrpB